MLNVSLIQCKQLLFEAGTFVASQLMHQPNSDCMFLKPFCPGLFLCGAFFTLAHGHELLHFFDDIFMLKSTQLVNYQTQMFDHHTRWQSVTQLLNVLLLATH